MIERYEKGELTATTSIHYVGDQTNVEGLFLPGIIIWDPLLQYFHGSLPCPDCGQILKPRYWKDGKDWKHNSPRRLADIEHYVLLVCRVYACRNDHRIISHDPQILKKFEQVEQIPFLLLHKYGITRRLYRLIIVHNASGIRYRDVEALLTEMSRSVMLKNLDRFVENWENREVAGKKILSQNAHDQLHKLRAHIEKGCLEGIPPKAGTSRQESMHKSLRKGVEKRRIGVKAAVASIGTCLYRWNERRISENVAVPAPVTKYQDLSVTQEEVFGTGVLQNPNSINEDDLEDGAEVNATQNDSTTDNSSDEEDYGTDDDNNVMITKEDTYHRVLEYAMYMKSLARDLQSKCDAPTLKVNLTQCVGRSLLLFSTRASYFRPDAEECDERLTSVLNAFEFQQLPMPGDGDCFLHCISITLRSFLTRTQDNSNLITHLKSIGINTEMSNEDKINVLRQLIVQEFTGPNRHLYEPFMITSTTDSYDTEAQKFLQPGHYDSELGNCVPLAMSNILQIPLVILFYVDGKLSHYTSNS